MQLQNEKYNGLTDKIEWTEKKISSLIPLSNSAYFRRLTFFYITISPQIPPYPSQDTLEQKMQDQANWDSYKTQTINNLLDTLHL